MPPIGFGVRPASVADAESIIRMKVQLAAAENATIALRWTRADWLGAGFTADAWLRA